MYHNLTMKLTSILLILATAASAQTTTPKTSSSATRPVVHHTTAARPASACAVEGVPAVLPAAIPKITGCPKPLYTLKYVDTLAGTGATVSPRKWLTVNYTGYLTDGTKFDSSIGTDKDGKPKQPITFPYGAHQVIVGWDTGFEGMSIGGKRRLYIPYQLAYGELGRPPVIPAKALLIFDVELVAISDTPPPPPPGSQPRPPAAQPKPATPPAGTTAAPNTPPAGTTPPATTPGAGAAPASDGAKPAPPAPGTDPTKPTATPPPASSTTPHL
jgi:peptidylprolyl isomerase